jgi:hypothetical protein
MVVLSSFNVVLHKFVNLGESRKLFNVQWTEENY